MQELVERVLGIGCWLTKENGPSGVFDKVVCGARNGFAIRFHGELLEVGGETVEVLVKSGRDMLIHE